MCGGCRERRQKNRGSAAGAFICSQPRRRRAAGGTPTARTQAATERRGDGEGRATPGAIARFDKGHKKGKSSAVFVCAAPDCRRTMSGAFFKSQRSVVTKDKKAHALTRQPKVKLVQGTHICPGCYKLYRRRHVSPDVFVARSRAWREEQRALAAAAARSPQPPRQARAALAVSKESSSDLPATTSSTIVPAPVAAPIVALEPPIGVVSTTTVSVSSADAVVATAAALNPTSAASSYTPVAECCDNHALARQVLFANAYGWFSVPANFLAGPRRAVCTDPSSRKAYPDLDWGLWNEPGQYLFGSDYYITDTTSRVTLIGDRSLLLKFLKCDQSSRQTLISCQKLQLIYSRAALAPTTKREELIRSAKNK